MKFLIKKKTASREATHPPISALTLLSGQTLHYSTALPHIVSSQCFHIDTVIDMVIEKSTLVQTASGELCFLFHRNCSEFCPLGNVLLYFCPSPPAAALTSDTQRCSFTLKETALLRHPCWYKILPNCHCQHWSWWNSIVTLLSSLEQGVGA